MKITKKDVICYLVTVALYLLSFAPVYMADSLPLGFVKFWMLLLVIVIGCAWSHVLYKWVTHQYNKTFGPHHITIDAIYEDDKFIGIDRETGQETFRLETVEEMVDWVKDNTPPNSTISVNTSIRKNN